MTHEPRGRYCLCCCCRCCCWENSHTCDYANVIASRAIILSTLQLLIDQLENDVHGIYIWGFNPIYLHLIDSYTDYQTNNQIDNELDNQLNNYLNNQLLNQLLNYMSNTKKTAKYIKFYSPLGQHRQKTIIKYNKINELMI